MAHLEAYTYEIPCTKRGCGYFPSGMREGLFLKIETNGGYGIGEYAPLAKIHEHSITDALDMAKDLPKEMLSDLFALDATLSITKLVSFFEQFPFPLSYLLSMAHFHHSQKKMSFAGGPKRALKISALIDASCVNEAVMLAQGYVAQGYSCLKIKVGSLPCDLEIKKIKMISSIAGKGVSLRLDANRKLSPFEAKTLLQGLGRVKLEYFEEPIFDMDDNTDLFQGLGVFVAADESFRPPFDLSAIAGKAKFLIIKPSRFHSLYQAMNLAKEASSLSIEPIFSPCFESEFTSAIVVHIINELGLLDRAHGVVIDDIFKHGVSKKPFRSFRGQLFIDNANQIIDDDFISNSQSLIRRV